MKKPSRFAVIAITLALAVASLTAGTVATASAASAPSAKKVPPALVARFKVACARIPALETRTDALITRLPGGPDSPGSIAHIKDLADTAQSKGHPEVASRLNTRAQTLTTKLAILPNEKAKLADIASKCQTWSQS